MTAKRRRACGRRSAWRICRRGWRPSGCWACCSFICAALPVGWPRGACADEASAARLIRGPNGSTNSARGWGSRSQSHCSRRVSPMWRGASAICARGFWCPSACWAGCLAGLLQTVVESFLFYHPAIWWMSRVIRAEREKCCDDLAVAVSGDAHDYATALAALEHTRWAANEAVLAATGGSLMKRIHRLLSQPKVSALAPVFSAGILMIAAVGAMAAWQASAPAPAKPATPQSNASPYTRWLEEDVVYIINDQERTAFLSLKTDAERNHFIQQFWERRNPTPELLDEVVA